MKRKRYRTRKRTRKRRRMKRRKMIITRREGVMKIKIKELKV